MKEVVILVFEIVLVCNNWYLLLIILGIEVSIGDIKYG